MEKSKLQPLYLLDNSSGWTGGRVSCLNETPATPSLRKNWHEHPQPESSSTESFYIIGCEAFGVIIE